MDTATQTSVLNDILTRNYDAKNGYTEAGNNVNHTALRKWLFQNAEDRQSFIQELKSTIHNLKGEVDTGSSFLSGLHRAWMDYKSEVTGSDTEVLKECERGEEKPIEDYEKVLSQSSLKPGVAGLLREQKEKIESSLSSLRVIKRSLAS